MADGGDLSKGEYPGLDAGARIVVLLGGVLAAMTLTALNSVLPLIAHDLAHGPRDAMLVKQLVGAVALAMVVGAPLGGFLADRLGLRRMLLIASLIYVIAGTSGLYLNDLRLLVASRLLLGLAAASIQVMSITLINTNLEGHERARWMGFHISVAMIGTIFIHPIAGFLGDFGWRWPFALYGTGLALTIAMLAGRRGEWERPAAHSGERPSLINFLKRFPLSYLPLALALGSLVFLPSVYLPYILRDLHGSSPSVIALVLTADSVIGATLAMFYGAARRKMSASAAFAVSFAPIAAGTLIAGLSSSLPGIITGMLVYGLGIGWLIPNLLTSLGARVPQGQQGRAAGLVKAAHFLAAPLAIAAMEPIARHYGPRSALFVVAALSGLLLVAITFRRRFSRSAPTAEMSETV